MDIEKAKIKAAERAMGDAIVKMTEGAKQYAQAYQQHFDSLIGTDYVLGDELAAILRAVHGLLNGPLPRSVDAGTLSTYINVIARDHDLLDKNGEIRSE